MSKSLGNFFTIRDVLELYHPFALRWFLVGTQYRAGLNYTQRALEEVRDAASRACLSMKLACLDPRRPCIRALSTLSISRPRLLTRLL
jgi:cysteinyl-tRNA synthetase